MTDRQTSEKEFRLNNMRLLLTYARAGHFVKDDYISWFKEKISMPVTFIRLAHEIGTENPDDPNIHTHVLVEFQRPFQSRNARIFDYQDFHCNIKPLKSKKAFDDAKLYIAKEDPENEDLKVKFGLADMVHTKNSAIEAINAYASRFSDVSGILQVYNLKSTSCNSRFNFEPHSEWQNYIVDLDNIDPDSRSILWLYDPVGNSGKTAMAKWLYLNKPNR